MRPMNDVLELFDLEPNHHLAVREGGKVRVRQVSDRVVRALRWNVDFWDPVPHASIQAWNARFVSAPRGRLAPYEAMSGLSVIDRDARWAALCDGGVRRTPAEVFSFPTVELALDEYASPELALFVQPGLVSLFARAWERGMVSRAHVRIKPSRGSGVQERWVDLASVGLSAGMPLATARAWLLERHRNQPDERIFERENEAGLTLNTDEPGTSLIGLGFTPFDWTVECPREDTAGWHAYARTLLAHGFSFSTSACAQWARHTEEETEGGRRRRGSGVPLALIQAEHAATVLDASLSSADTSLPVRRRL